MYVPNITVVKLAAVLFLGVAFFSSTTLTYVLNVTSTQKIKIKDFPVVGTKDPVFFIDSDPYPLYELCLYLFPQAFTVYTATSAYPVCDRSLIKKYVSPQA